MNTCICGSKKSVDKCCGRFLSGTVRAKTPEQLMRSRYSAHALGGYGEYLVSTWWAAVELGLTAESFAENAVSWKKLDVLNASQKANEGLVEFKAYFYPEGESTLQVHHERSLFKRVKGVWYYVEAEGVEVEHVEAEGSE